LATKSPKTIPSSKTSVKEGPTVVGYMPEDTPPAGAMLSLGFQQVLTMFPATVLVALLTHFDIGVTLLASGIGTIIALLVSKRRIPLYYGSSFSYIAIVGAVVAQYAGGCASTFGAYCPEGVRIVQVGILGTAVVEIAFGFLIMRVGKASLDKILPPVITGSVAIVIGISLAFSAIQNAAGANIAGPAGWATTALTHPYIYWGVAGITLLFTIIYSVYLQGRGLIGMLPILLGALTGYVVSLIFDALHLVPAGLPPLVDFSGIAAQQWLRAPAITIPAFADPRAWGAFISIALIAIATIPESTAHLYQMSLYIDQLAKDLKRKPTSIKNLIGLNLVADGSDDIVNAFLGGCAGTNYGENNSLMAITRNYSTSVLITAGVIAIALGFIGKLAAVVQTIPQPVVGGLSIYLFGVIGKQGVALIQSERVNLFDPKNLAIGATILVLGIGGSIGLPNGFFPFPIPAIFPNGIPAIVFSAIFGILLNLLFVVLPPSKFGVKERSELEY
jgi:uracil permease